MEILTNLEHDGLDTPDVGSWALEKLRPHAYYARLFATAMKPPKWDQLCYIGLCSGSGRARLRDTGQIVETAAMTVLRLPDPFTKYIFCDQDAAKLDALRERAEPLRGARGFEIAYIRGDLNDNIGSIEREIPSYSKSNTLLTFAFLDPFATNIRFEAIRRLSERRAVDWLILLPLSVDARRNLRSYMAPESFRLDEFLGDPHWRDAWGAAKQSGMDITAFLATHFARRMTGIGYLATELREMRSVRSDRRNLALYFLAFFSKDELGKKFWREAQDRTADQYGLGL
jgi:three-Cys-motif partner protein